MGRKEVRSWGRWGLALVFCLLCGGQAAGEWRIYSTPADVLPHASHVVGIALPPEEQGWRVTKIYRGTLATTHVDFRALLFGPAFGPHTGRALVLGDPVQVLTDARKREEAVIAELVVSLYELDGRYHLVGGRPGHGADSSASVWYVDTSGRTYRIGPNLTRSPVLLRLPLEGQEALAEYLEALVAKHPFQEDGVRPVPVDERAKFFALIDEGLDWYKREPTNTLDALEARKALVDRLAAYGHEAPPSMALHVLDALQILGGGRAVPSELQTHIRQRLGALIERFGIEAFEAFVLQQLDSGPYIDCNRALLLLVLRDTDAAAYRRGVGVLRALCLRRMDNEAVGAYWALKYAGEELIVQEIDAQWAEWDKDDPTSQMLREAEKAEEARKKAEARPPAAPDLASSEGELVPAGIEVGPRSAPVAAPPSPDKAEQGEGPSALLMLVLGACTSLLGLWVWRRR
jgi:hypothetical protein